MAYPSHVAARDAAARSGGFSRTILAGCALAAMTAGVGYGVSQYVDLAELFGRAPAGQPAGATRRAAADPAELTLFDPKLSLGVGAGFVPAAPRSAQVAAATPAADPAPPSAPVRIAKPTPLPDDSADEIAAPMPAARPAATEASAAASETAAPEIAAPEPPRRPADLAPPLRTARAPAALARREPAVPAGPTFRMGPANAPPQTARAERGASAPASADPLERFPGNGRLAAAEPTTPRARARVLQRRVRSAAARATAQEPSFFQKLFGAPAQTTTALAYAPTSRIDDAMRPSVAASIAASRRSFASLGSDTDVSPAPRAAIPRLGGGRAIYDISAQTVTLPDGTRLEAHSGLGAHRDNIASVRLKMRGVTPPHVYNLTEREALFHGVRAIRLTPVGGAGAIHGRAGLLAHTYMLGPNGDSNGCVSIRNYNAFLNAFLDGKISQLVVVESAGGLNRFASR